MATSSAPAETSQVRGEGPSDARTNNGTGRKRAARTFVLVWDGSPRQLHVIGFNSDTGTVVFGGGLIGVIVAIITLGAPGLYKFGRSLWKDRATSLAEGQTRNVQIIELGQEGLSKWGENMAADNQRLRDEVKDLRAENVTLRKDLESANRAIANLTIRLSRLESDGNS